MSKFELYYSSPCWLKPASKEQFYRQRARVQNRVTHHKRLWAVVIHSYHNSYSESSLPIEVDACVLGESMIECGG